YLFKEQKPAAQPPLKGANPAPVGGGNPPRQYTMEELGKLSIEECAAYRGQQGGFPKNERKRSVLSMANTLKRGPEQ
ncbi:MAG: hypothetical protein AAGU02_07265, partial [Lawsonibacter sp.]